MPTSPRPTDMPEVQSAPADTEDARTLLQARLEQMARIGATFGLLFLAVSVSIALTVRIVGAGASMLAQSMYVLVTAGVWLYMRGGVRSSRALGVVDAVSTLANCFIFVAIGWTIPIWVRPEFVQLLCVTDILVLRAFLVPSTPKRTAVLAIVPVLAILASTWWFYSHARPHPDAPGPIAYFLIASIFGSGTILITTYTSRTIFGLRERVRAAIQLGQYTLLDKIGEGGMGIVYKARHAMLRRPTAIKVLPVERMGEHNLTRFEREVQLTSMLTHPNTVSIYDYGRTSNGALYYAMEYLDGIDLETLVDMAGPQDPGRVIHLLRQICGALDEAHGLGLVHRDVKPANVLLCQRGGIADFVKVVDFGLVKSLDAPGDAAATAVDQIVGTPLYMSPESIVEPDRVDARSDLYAVGALGYFLLVGEPPFTGRTIVEVCSHHLHSAPAPPAERLGRTGSLGLDWVILSCLEKAREKRPASARDIARALEECANVDPWTAEKGADWWRVHGDEVRASRAERVRRASAESQKTVAVDLRQRATEALGG